MQVFVTRVYRHVVNAHPTDSILTSSYKIGAVNTVGSVFCMKRMIPHVNGSNPADVEVRRNGSIRIASRDG